MDLQLWAFAPGGDEPTILPQPLHVEASMVLSDIGAMSITYPLGAPGREMLDDYCDVELRYWDGTGWVCPPQGRFTVQDWQTDPASEWNTPTRSYTLVSWGYLLDSARQYDVSALNSSGNRLFFNVTPAKVAETVIAEAQAAGFVPSMTISNLAVSAGWAPTVAPGASAAQILADGRDQGFCEWLFQPDAEGFGRKLTLYDSVGVDRSMGDDPVTVQITALGEVTTAPSKRTARDMITDVLVQGDQGAFVKMHNTAAAAPFGVAQGFVSAAGVTDLTQLQTIGQAALDAGAVPAAQLTRTVEFAGARWLPLRDYGVGDTILGPDEHGTLAPLRVQQITLVLDGDLWSADLVLGDRLAERTIAMERRLRKMSAPYILGGGRPVQPPAPPIMDNTTPPVSSALTATSKLGTVTLTWNGKDENGADVAAGFDHAEAERDVSGSFPNPVNVGTFGSRGKIDDAGLTIGTTYYYRLVIVNAAGVRAAAGSAVAVTAVGVKGPDLEANSVTANKINVGTLDAISADLGTINAGTINGVDINGAVITGGTFRTASSGARIQISSTSAGSVAFIDSSGNGGSMSVGSSSVQLQTPSASGFPGVLALSENGFSVSLRGGTVLSFPAPQGAGNSSIMSGGGMSITASGNLNLNGAAVNINGSSVVTGSVVRPGDSPTFGTLTCGPLYTDSPPSSTGTAVGWNSSGRIVAISSSRRNKIQINELTRVERVLDLHPVFYKYRGESAQVRRIGLIAEETAEVLPELVINDAEGLPFSVQYQAIGVALLPLVKELWADYKERQNAA